VLDASRDVGLLPVGVGGKLKVLSFMPSIDGVSPAVAMTWAGNSAVKKYSSSRDILFEEKREENAGRVEGRSPGAVTCV